MVDCMVGVVSEQCGEEIAGYVSDLSSQILDNLNCARRQRQYFCHHDLYSRKRRNLTRIMAQYYSSVIL